MTAGHSGAPGAGVAAATGRRLRLGVPAAVFLLALLPFLPALDGAFLTWDDDRNFVLNTAYRGLGWAQWKAMWTGTVTGHYVPLTWMTFSVNWLLGGLDPWGYHLGNLLLHAANSLLFYLVARRLLGAAGDPERTGRRLTLAAAFAALVFALHPLRVEPVAWVTGRLDLLSAFFALAAALAYLRGVEAPGGLARGWGAAALACYAAALLSKATVIPLPAAFLLVDVYPLRRLPRLGWRALFREKLPFAAVGLAGVLVALLAMRADRAVTGWGQYGPAARVGMAAYGFLFYPWKFLWPVGLSPLYELPPEVDLRAWRFLLPAAGAVLLTVALILLRRRWPAGLAAWTYSVVMLLPLSGLVHSGHQLAHDRYAYVPGLGLALLAGGGLGQILRLRERGRLGAPVGVSVLAAAALVLALLGAGSWRQSRIWLDSEALWRWAVDVDPACAICRNNLGAQLVHVGPLTPERAQEAEVHLRRAIALRPGLSPAYFSLGVALGAQGKSPEAEGAWREFARREPQVAEGPARHGLFLLDQGRAADAIPLLKRALALEPGLTAARDGLARALREEAGRLAAAGRPGEATALLGEAAQLGAR